jgi:hypothetical protein
VEGSREGTAAETARWRIITAWVLVVVASLVALGASLDVWVKRQALDANNWANTSSDLLQNDQIRAALSVYLVDELYSNVDVTAELQQRLPAGAQGLAAPLAGALRQGATRGVDDLLSRPRVQQAWKKANRRAAELFLAVVDNKTKRLQTSNGEVALDLRPLIQQLAQRQGVAGQIAQKLPPDAGRLVIMKSNQLGAVQTGVRVIRALSYFLAILVLGLYSLAVYLVGPGRRRTLLMSVGFAILIVGVVLLIVRRLVGDYIVSALTSNPDFDAASAAVWAIGTQLLRNVAVNFVVYGVVIVLAAWIAGPSRPATALRRWLAPTLREHPVIVYALVTLALLIVLASGPTDSSRLIPVLILFGFAYLGVEIFRRETAREFPDTS